MYRSECIQDEFPPTEKKNSLKENPIEIEREKENQKKIREKWMVDVREKVIATKISKNFPDLLSIAMEIFAQITDTREKSSKIW